MTELGKKIKEDYGTILRFCKINGINPRTYRTVVGGHGSSSRIVVILKRHGYIKSANELKRKRK